MENRGFWSVHNACLCCSFVLTLFPCSIMGSLPRDTDLHELLQCGSFPQGTVLQEQTAQAWISHGPQFLPGACSSTGPSWAGASFKAHPPAAAWGPPWAAMWISALLWSSMGCSGTTCLTMVLSMGCSSPAASTWAPTPNTLV